MRTAVVLPAPFGPSSAEHRSALDPQVDAAERLHVLVRLCEALGLDCELLRHTASHVSCLRAPRQWGYPDSRPIACRPR